MRVARLCFGPVCSDRVLFHSRVLMTGFGLGPGLASHNCLFGAPVSLSSVVFGVCLSGVFEPGAWLGLLFVWPMWLLGSGCCWSGRVLGPGVSGYVCIGSGSSGSCVPDWFLVVARKFVV